MIIFDDDIFEKFRNQKIFLKLKFNKIVGNNKKYLEKKITLKILKLE